MLAKTPWTTDHECGDETVLDADGNMVADCSIVGMDASFTDERCRANAKLCAAAPDLLEALIDLLQVIATDELVPESVSFMRQARAAVAKVK